ncbi:hypothetical protein PTTG_26519, partial [Puccinia triticina 1-1 BBBD Race 1]
AFYSARQGSKTIEEFNILFNALLHPLKLDDCSKCKAYDKAIDPNLVKLALIRGPWNDFTDLDFKQQIAVSVSRNLAGVTKILDPRSHQNRSINQSTQHHPPAVQAHHSVPKTPNPDAMDVDEISSAIKDSGFSYA